jgi:hypothetical protein
MVEERGFDEVDAWAVDVSARSIDLNWDQDAIAVIGEYSAGRVHELPHVVHDTESPDESRVDACTTTCLVRSGFCQGVARDSVLWFDGSVRSRHRSYVEPLDSVGALANEEATPCTYRRWCAAGPRRRRGSEP